MWSESTPPLKIDSDGNGKANLQGLCRCFFAPSFFPMALSTSASESNVTRRNAEELRSLQREHQQSFCCLTPASSARH